MKKFLALLLASLMVLGLFNLAVAETASTEIDPALVEAAKAEGELTVYASCEEAYMVRNSGG